MRRRLVCVGVVLGLLGAALVAGPSSAEPVPETEFVYGIVAREGPPAPSGTRFDYQAQLRARTGSGSETRVSGVPVVFWARPYAAKTFTQVDTATTDADGNVETSAVLQRNSELKWTFAGNAEYAATTSHSFFEVVGPKIRTKVNDSSLKRRQKLVVTGRSDPLKPGQRVSLWLGDRPAFLPDLEMTRLTGSVVRPDGTYRLAFRFSKKGTKKLYVKIGAGNGNGEGYSKYVRVRVR